MLRIVGNGQRSDGLPARYSNGLVYKQSLCNFICLDRNDTYLVVDEACRNIFCLAIHLPALMTHSPVQTIDLFKSFGHFLAQANALDSGCNLTAQTFQEELGVCIKRLSLVALNIKHA